jgi:Flp pilus assembly protein TadD
LAAPAFTAMPAPLAQPLVLGLPGQPLPGAKASTTSQELPRPAPASQSPWAAALRAGLLIAGDHTKAAALHAQCIRELKNGSVERAHQLARQALNAAPDITLYRDTLAEWPQFVAAHRTPDDVRAKAQAVLAEEAGDFEKALTLLRQSVATNPKNASAWNRLAVLLATRKGDIAGAVDAAQKAVELVPDDATYLSNFTKFAALADKGGGLDQKKRGLWNRLLGK